MLLVTDPWGFTVLFYWVGLRFVHTETLKIKVLIVGLHRTQEVIWTVHQ